jgi:lipopolysaccharide transport system ATP-binding protein
MTNCAIKVDNLGKLYRINQQQERYATLRDSLAETLVAPFQKAAKHFRKNHNDSNDNRIWALRDLSLEVEQGEVVGVIGRNGAGKSTLLKILSRITEPTQGYVDINGRVGSLLEVGTGFHPELTGRENVFLNGAILGMRREEINRKFDEIVAFSEVERFIDTPVKRYSSGMHMRLAFSVAAHLQTEILLVDEVLAVGDIAFQRKCLGKMEDVAAHGKTVLFVSHNLGTIKELCQTAVVLDSGLLDFKGPVVEGLARYSQKILEGEDKSTVRSTGWGPIYVTGESGRGVTAIHSGEIFSVRSSLDIRDAFDSAHLVCKIHDAVGNPIVFQRADCSELVQGKPEPGNYTININLPPLWLTPGVYTVFLKFVGRKMAVDEVHSSERAVLDVIGRTNGKSRASLSPSLKWTMLESTGSSPAQPNGHSSDSLILR